MALGEVAKQFLDQAFGIRTVAHVVALGGAQTNPDLPSAHPRRSGSVWMPRLSVRWTKRPKPCIIERINEAKKASDTLGGVIEVLAYGVPAGIGTYVESDRRLDAALASAIMGIQAFKGVEIGETASWKPPAPVRRRTMRSWSTPTAASTVCPTAQAALKAVCPMAR